MKLQTVVKEKKYAKYLPPLKRLIVQSPEIFQSAPGKPPEGASTTEKACSACGIPPFQGWGNAFCRKCGHADEILWHCLGQTGDPEQPEPAMLPVLHRIVGDFGVSSPPDHI